MRSVLGAQQQRADGSDVAGVATLSGPVSAAQARQLIAVARPARYVLGKQTLTDSRLRHTWGALT